MPSVIRREKRTLHCFHSGCTVRAVIMLIMNSLLVPRTLLVPEAIISIHRSSFIGVEWKEMKLVSPIEFRQFSYPLG